jgi:RNA polymerase sigma-70 factor, ECF subfamily
MQRRAGSKPPPAQSTDPSAAAQPNRPPGNGGVIDGPNPISDGDLVRNTLAGNRGDFDQLVIRYQRQAVAVSYRLLGSTHDAMEVVQDSFLKAYAGLASLQKPEAFGGWLLRIVSNLSLNYRRSRKVRAQLPLDDALHSPDAPAGGQGDSSSAASDGIDPARALASKELGTRLMDALAELPEKQRLAIVLFTIEQMPQKDVAAALDCSVEAVKWHVFQGRKRLKVLLKDYV